MLQEKRFEELNKTKQTSHTLYLVGVGMSKEAYVVWDTMS